MPQTYLLRRLEVASRFGLPKTTFQERINEGLITPPINLGGRAVAWPDYEIDQIINAMIAGYSKDEIKALVQELIHQRAQLAQAS